MGKCYPVCTWRAIPGLLKPWHSFTSAQHDLQELCPGANVEKENVDMASRDVRHQREPTFRSIRMGWWQTRCAMSLTSWEWSVAENIITCTQGKQPLLSAERGLYKALHAASSTVSGRNTSAGLAQHVCHSGRHWRGLVSQTWQDHSRLYLSHMCQGGMFIPAASQHPSLPWQSGRRGSG